MFFFRDGHQNCLLIRCKVLTKPKCPAALESWLFPKTISLWLSSTYNLVPIQASLSWIEQTFPWFWNHLLSFRVALSAAVTSLSICRFSFACDQVVTWVASWLDGSRGLTTSALGQLYGGIQNKASVTKFFPTGSAQPLTVFWKCKCKVTAGHSHSPVTTQLPQPHWKTKGALGLGFFRTSSAANSRLSFSKAAWHSKVHLRVGWV